MRRTWRGSDSAGRMRTPAGRSPLHRAGKRARPEEPQGVFRASGQVVWRLRHSRKRVGREHLEARLPELRLPAQAGTGGKP